MNINEAVVLIKQWAIDRNLPNKATIKGQMVKTAEENAELIIGISKEDKELIKDSVGDVFVTLVIGNMLDQNYDIAKIAKEASTIFDIENKESLVGFEIAEDEVLKKDKHYLIKMLNANINQIMNGVIGTSLVPGYKSIYLEDYINILVSVCLENDLTLIECIEAAYNEIANRKGKMINGVFVKEEDLK